MTPEHKQRLLNLARAARETRHPFNMEQVVTSCGSPGCLFGNYASRQDLQDVFYVGTRNDTLDRTLIRARYSDNGRAANIDDIEVQEHFGLTYDEIIELFEVDGCGNARNDAEKAARYVEQFVARREAP